MTTRTYSLDDMTIREIIDRRLEELGVSRYRLAHNVAQTPKRRQRRRSNKKRKGVDTLSASSTFRFLNGDHDTMGENVEAMLRACGLRIVPSGRVPPWVRKLKVG